MKTSLLLLIIIIALCGTLLSALLVSQHYNQAHEIALVSMMCGDNTVGGCATVNRSTYSELFGIPVAAFGVAFYLSLTLLVGLAVVGDESLKQAALQIGFLIVSLAVVVDVILLAIQFFALDAFCNLCISTYVCTGLLFAFLFSSGKRISRVSMSVLLQSAIGKMLFAGWLIGSLGVTFGAIAWSKMLAYQDPTQLEARFSETAVKEYEAGAMKSIDLTNTPFKGKENSPIKVVVYSDFLCPWCRQVALTFQQHLSMWEGKVVVYYKNYPLDPLCNKHHATAAHNGACFAALGGLCAEQQGKFWEYHDRAYEKPPRDGRDRDIINIAHEVGIDTVAFKACLASSPMQRTIQRQVEEAFAFGIDGTPRIFINGKKLPQVGYLRAVLTSEAKRLGIPPLEGLNE